jgi:hypothetical protein
MPALVVVLLVVTCAVLVVLVRVLQRLLRAIEGVETAVWAVAEELQGGVGLRLRGRAPFSRQ